MAKSVIKESLTFVDFVELVRCKGENLDLYEGFFCQTLDFNPYTDFVHEMFVERNR